ncbi:MAG: NADPH2:quinone reductase [Glaciecola sp.]|jgi:NADPH2:quinone reductase
MAKAIVLREYGGPENLRLETVETGTADDASILIRNVAIGVNFIDTYFRRGIYPTTLPAVIGDQGVGIVEECGSAVTHVNVGDRVAYASIFGAYIDRRWVDSSQVVRVPDEVSSEVAAASLTRGLTAEYLLFRLHSIKPSDTIIVHAAAGGTGSIICQWAQHMGATVIGTVGSEAKFEAAKQAGCDFVLLHSQDDFVEQIRDITNDTLVDVVYDSVGKDTFNKSLACIKPRGLMVAFGNASGKPDPMDVLALARCGSLFLTRPILTHYVSTQEELELSAARYFAALADGIVTPHALTAYTLNDASAAHEHLEDRSKLSIPILVP